MNNRRRPKKASLFYIRESLFSVCQSRLLRRMFGMAIRVSDRATNTAASNSRPPAIETAGNDGNSFLSASPDCFGLKIELELS
jgi:hypothetical protein